ncbi:MAG: YebC/PmpR family DNA-binding transcriptional regulator [Eubacteriaceae bacterium]|nr:YebC/PmpR family DNA-binding transcriptional regulator [Eubacteriaceae bacterium]
MSGHSKWANIKNKKGKADEAKGAIYTKLAKFIMVAAKEGGGDPAYNSKLREAIMKAKAANMTNDNIDRAIKKGTGESGGANWETITYEGYGIGGVAVILEALTDNRNRTAGDVRHAFDKYGGNLGTNGCVSFMFDKKGVIVLDTEELTQTEDELMELALEAGAEDFVYHQEDGLYEIITSPEDFLAVSDALEKAGLSPISSELTMIPQNTVDLSDPDAVAKFNKMIDMFEANDDVQEVWHNAQLPEE